MFQLVFFFFFFLAFSSAIEQRKGKMNSKLQGFSMDLRVNLSWKGNGVTLFHSGTESGNDECGGDKWVFEMKKNWKKRVYLLFMAFGLC